LGEPIDIPFAIAPMPTDQPGRLGHDFVFIEDYQGPDSSGSDRLYVAVDNGNQSYVFQLSWRDPQLALKLIPFYLPMRLFGGKALVSDGRQVYYDHRGRWLPLVQEERPRFVLKAEVRRKFDAGAPNCVWHRLMLDGCIPPGTSVRVSSRDSDDEDQLEILPWQDEPDFYLRRDGSEQPFTGLRTKGGRGTWELLLQQASGRFLELRLNIEGNGRSTPRLRALRVYYPRFSYLNRYLPAVYREEPEPASFLDRFLANLEGFYTAIEDKIAMVDLLFDPESAPSETLGWLIGWFGVTTDPAWDPDRQRLFLRHAGELLQARGTIPGILMALRLAFDQAPGDEIFRAQNAVRKGSGGLRIVEKYRRRLTPRVPAQAGGAKIQKLWSDFLARRYSSVSFLNNKQGTYWKRFEDISTPQTLPSDEAQRDDWHDFQSVVTPLHSTAHQFTVFLPMPLGSIDPSERRRRQELVERVVNLEKPAHTLFDVKFYWESFAVGSARLGDDTLLGPGGRNPALMTGMVLGRGHLAETYLAPYPRVERYYVGSESLGPKLGVAQ